MAGIYIHIPFCRQACYYCNFHFSTNTTKVDEMTAAIVKEIKMQKDYLPSKVLETIYFGGGTPSILSEVQLNLILAEVYQHFEVIPNAEITLEANPDDLSLEKIKSLKRSGINRLSIGIQSFDDQNLKAMNRIHSSEEAIRCVRDAQKEGIENISIDLIYAMPSENHDLWRKDLEIALALNVPHISSYCLTVEEKTVLGNWTRKGKFHPMDDDFAAEQFEILVETLLQNGFEHYEISNFAKPGWHSKHNSNYWKQVPYLGVGPGAHSFDGKNRQFNATNNAHYLKALSENTLPFELDELSREDNINEYIMISLRTKWGCTLSYLKNHYQFDLLNHFEKEITSYISGGYLVLENDTLLLTEKGKLLADQIAGDLFL